MTEEPSASLPCPAREERRRTLWSLYLLDKLATCGRRRPALFLDQTCNLRLPSSDLAFHLSIVEDAPTLEDFKLSDDFDFGPIDSPVRSIVVASVLSQIARYMLHHSDKAGRRPPWDHQSEYPKICTQLGRLETMFDCIQPIHDWIVASSLAGHENTPQVVNTFLFSYIIYQLCYCLLHHPFLLRNGVGRGATRIPTSFLSQSLDSCRSHAQELVTTLTQAKVAGFSLNATFYGYCLLVSGTIHALFQHSANDAVRHDSAQSLDCCLRLLEEKARFWGNSARMVGRSPSFFDPH